MKKIKILAAAFILTAATASSIEWGGLFKNKTQFDGKDFSDLNLDQKDSLSLWQNIPLSKSGNQYIALEESYTFRFDKDGDPQISNILDLSVCKYAFAAEFFKNSSFIFNLGRFSFSDSTGLIFNQNSDGAYAKLTISKFNISAYAGYTGLINSQTVTILTPETTKYVKPTNILYTLSPKYVPVYASLTIPSLFTNQTLSAEAYVFFDLNQDNYNRYYASASIKGFITNSLSYLLTSVVGTENFQNVSNLSIARLSFSPANFMKISAGGIYASGNHGPFKAFRGFTSIASDISQEEPEYTGLIKANANISISILNKVLAEGEAAAIFNFADATPSYKGFQYNASAAWNIFNDLQVSASLGQFFGEDASKNKTTLSIDLSLSF